MTKTDSELGRATDYVEATFQNLKEKVDKFVADGLSYDILIFKDGREVHQIPVAVATALIAVSTLPPVRVMSFLALAGANIKGYTFKLKKK